MGNPDTTTPAPAETGNGRQKSDQLGSQIDVINSAPHGIAQAGGAFCQPPTSDIAAAGVHNGIPFDRYPASPGFKTHGPSSEAAEAIAPVVPRLRARVLQAFTTAGRAGLTADEAAAEINASILSVRPRVAELYRLGLIAKTGDRRRNASGLDATVWTAADSRGAAS